MNSLILCHKERAKQPYEIVRIHTHIYTIEELCYYFCNNLYLIDKTIVNRNLVDWLETELKLYELAEELKYQLDENKSIEQFVLTILSHAAIYSAAEVAKIHNVLERLKNEKDVEREKNKADNLLKAGEYASAILVYQEIVDNEWDDSVEEIFYGRVYERLAEAYGRIFLYEEAADMYEKAYKICVDEKMLKKYLYCCYKYMSEEEYVKMLSKESAFLSIDAELKQQFAAASEHIQISDSSEKIEEWKKEYRRVEY